MAKTREYTTLGGNDIKVFSLKKDLRDYCSINGEVSPLDSQSTKKRLMDILVSIAHKTGFVRERKKVEDRESRERGYDPKYDSSVQPSTHIKF